MPTWSQLAGSDVLLAVFVKPNRSKSALLGVRSAEGRTVGTTTAELEVGLAAPPVDGAANAELVAFLARTLKVAKRSIEIQSGQASRHKIVRLRDATLEAVERALGS